MWVGGQISQGSVVCFRAAFTLDASFHYLLGATAGLNELCRLLTGQVLTHSISTLPRETMARSLQAP
jgi:hypothetical protein